MEKGREIKVDGLNSFYIGKHTIRNGSRSQSFFKAPSPMRDFYRCNKDFFDTFELDVEKNIVAKGCWDTNKITIQRTAIPDDSFGAYSEFSEFFKMINPIIFEIIKKIPYSTLPTCSFDDVKYTLFNKNTLPGFRYEQYLNKKTKEFAANDAIKISNRRWNYIEKCSRTKVRVEREHLIPSVYTIGARNKRDYTFEEDEYVTSRAVHMPEFHVELCCAPWIDQITEHLTDVKRGSIYIGHSFLECERLEKVFRDSKIVIEGDWKRFDSTLYKNIILCGIALLRCFYSLDDLRIDNHFIAIADALLIKDYYVPGGDLYRLFHGLPSGVKATNLIGSLINLIALGFSIGKSNIAKADFIVGGDDFLISLKRKVNNFSLQSMKDNAEIIGMSYKVLKEKKINAKNLDDRPTFYKYVIKNSKPIIPTTALYERIMMPWNKNHRDIYEVYEFLKALIPSLASPSSACIPFYYFYCAVRERSTGVKTSISDTYKIHETVFNKVMLRKTPIYYKNPQEKMIYGGRSVSKYENAYILKVFNLIKHKESIVFENICF